MNRKTSSELSKLYQIRYDDAFLIRKSAIWRVICKNFYQRFVRHSDTVIDVASGHGEFINHIHAKRKIAVDLRDGAEKTLNKDIEFHQFSAEQVGQRFPNQADIIFVSNFLEHLPDKKALLVFLEEVMKSLKPGGRFMIVGPNLRYLPGQYWDYFDHYLGLTHNSLSEALELKGFEIEVCIDRFLPHSDKGNSLPNPFYVWLYFKLPFAWKFFGKQFFVVAQRPE
jgi:SAM-dependent methyltransferase